MTNRSPGCAVVSAVSTSTYSMSGCTAMARFDGSVHGVVVQIRAYAPSRSVPGARRRSPTVTAGSCRSV